MLEGIHFNLGLCYFLSGRFAETEKQFRRYVQLYPRERNVVPAEVFTADSLRYRGEFDRAIREYERIREGRRLNADWLTDVLCSLVRCHLAQDDWESAMPLLEKAYRHSPDRRRANWAATLLTTAYVRAEKLEQVYNLVPYLLQEGAFAARSVAFNLSTLEVADRLFARERYRDALWLYRLVFPLEVIEKGCKQRIAEMDRRADRIRRYGGEGQYRALLRIQETTGELEAELEAIEEVKDYGEELRFRIARSYFETHRWLEAREAFLELHESSLDEERREECLFLAFLCAFRLEPWGPAFELGERNMDTYPDGTYYDRVSLTVGQMHAQRKAWPQVIEVFGEALQISPDHESVAECMFLTGYSHFMLEQYEPCVEWLERLNREYPGNDRMMEATYWTGMGSLFSTEYEKARAVFGAFLADFPESPYLVDAEFRHAVCQYGLSEFVAAERELKRFVAEYAEDERAAQLLGEAHMMIADCAGNFGRSGEAIRHYRQAVEQELNIAHYNYCSFRAAEMMADNEQWSALVDFLETYAERNRDGSNIPMAVFWISKAYWQMERHEEALDRMLKAVEKYGADRAAIGIDLILDEWLGKGRRLDEEPRGNAWRALSELYARAKEEKQLSLMLRLLRVFRHRPDQSETDARDILKLIVRERSIPHASGAVLELILDEAPGLGKDQLSTAAAREIVKVFPETDFVIAARMHLGGRAADRGDLDEAEEHFRVITSRFASTAAAGDALMLLGRAYFEAAQIREADECFQRVLDVRSWREHWAEAVYWRGECLRVNGKYEKATAFYERVYIMYTAYPEWVARAYFRRAQCLERLKLYGKARETLNELLADESLAEYPAAAEAKELLDQMNSSP